MMVAGMRRIGLAHLPAPRLAVDVKDAQNDLTLAIPGVTLDIGRSQGRAALNAPATLAIGKRQTRVSTLEGGASFDGRALKLTGVSLRSDEGALQLDGVLSLLVRDPAIDLHAAGRADVERLAHWGIEDGQLPRGSVAFDVRATGAMAKPVADVRLTSSA